MNAAKPGGVEAYFDALLQQQKQQSYERGQQEATSIQLGESSYGATQSAYVCIEFNRLRDLINHIKARRGCHNGDNPGQVFAWSCELIDIHHNDYGKTALLKCSTHWDI